MAFDFYMPDIGEGVVEGEIVAWKVKEGDKVKLDQPIVEVMTDKATVELPSPRAGTIAKINYKDGEICPVGKVLVVIDEEGATAAIRPPASSSSQPLIRPPASSSSQPSITPPASSSSQALIRPPASSSSQAPITPITPPARSSERAQIPKAGNGHLPAPVERAPEPRANSATHQVMHRQVAASIPPPSTSSTPTSSPSSPGSIQVVDATAGRVRVLATPATRRLARQLGVEIGHVPATGKHGRVTTEDVKRFESNGAATTALARLPAPAAARSALGYAEERIPLRGMRKRIAESMARSVHTAAHFTYVEEIDMTELVTVRARAKARAADRGVKLTYLPFIIKAVVSGLKKWPQLNASLDEATQEIVRKKYYHIGVAAQGPQGLVVTVVRDADLRSIFDLSREIDRLGEAVRTNTATRDELTGSTFTISSLGKLGGVLATPIINFPEVAIVGVHKIEEKPAVRDGEIVARHLMNLSISVDHRLADGWDGAMFLQDVKALLEDPTTMFMEMV